MSYCTGPKRHTPLVADYEEPLVYQERDLTAFGQIELEADDPSTGYAGSFSLTLERLIDEDGAEVPLASIDQQAVLNSLKASIDPEDYFQEQEQDDEDSYDD